MFAVIEIASALNRYNLGILSEKNTAVVILANLSETNGYLDSELIKKLQACAYALEDSVYISLEEDQKRLIILITETINNFVKKNYFIEDLPKYLLSDAVNVFFSQRALVSEKKTTVRLLGLEGTAEIALCLFDRHHVLFVERFTDFEKFQEKVLLL